MSTENALQKALAGLPQKPKAKSRKGKPVARAWYDPEGYVIVAIPLCEKGIKGSSSGKSVSVGYLRGALTVGVNDVPMEVSASLFINPGALDVAAMDVMVGSMDDDGFQWTGPESMSEIGRFEVTGDGCIVEDAVSILNGIGEREPEPEPAKPAAPVIGKAARK